MFELVFPLMAGTGQTTADATMLLLAAFAFLMLLSTAPAALRARRNA